MAAFRIFSRVQTFFGEQAQLLAGGELRFFEADTVTPADVYGDKELTVNNGSTVALDSSGRSALDVWGDGEYFVEVYDSEGVKQGEIEDVEVAGGGGSTLPALTAGYFLTNNGAVTSWAPINEVPDPTGQSGKVLGNDGENFVWQAVQEIPEPPEPDISVTTTEFRASGGGATSFYVQQGASSAPASGSKATTASVTFAEEFNEAPKVFVTNTTGYVTQSGNVQPTVSVTSRSTTGFTVLFSTQTGEANSDANIVSPVAFDWIAFGTITTPVDIEATV